MSESEKHIESRISEACEIARQQKNPNISALARQFDVPRCRLAARFAGRGPREGRPASHKTLNDSQETEIIQMIRRFSSTGLPPSLDDIESSANAILRRDAVPVTAGFKRPKRPNAEPKTTETTTESFKRVSKNWKYLFVKRLPPNMGYVPPEQVDRQRSAAVRKIKAAEVRRKRMEHEARKKANQAAPTPAERQRDQIANFQSARIGLDDLFFI